MQGTAASHVVVQASLSSIKRFLFFQKTSELKISVELEGVEFGAEASFLVGALSVHADVKLASLWTVSSSWPG